MARGTARSCFLSQRALKNRPETTLRLLVDRSHFGYPRDVTFHVELFFPFFFFFFDDVVIFNVWRNLKSRQVYNLSGTEKRNGQCLVQQGEVSYFSEFLLQILIYVIIMIVIIMDYDDNNNYYYYELRL